MVHTSLIAKSTDIHLVIPEEYVGKELDIFYLPKEEIQEEKQEKKVVRKTMADFWGILSDKTADAMRKEVANNREEWEERFKKQF